MGADKTMEAFRGLYPKPVVDEVLQAEGDLKAFAARFAEVLQGGDFLGLIGGLGAGKTTFMKGLLSGLPGGEEHLVSSPTYSLVQIYEETTLEVVHMDLYRLEHIDDLEGIGFWDYQGTEALLAVEWIDRIPEAWPEQGWIVRIEKAERGRRLLLYADRDRRSRWEKQFGS